MVQRQENEAGRRHVCESAQNQHAKTQQQAAAASTTGIVPAAATAAQSKMKYARHLQHLAKASRMPELPPDDYKIGVRPKGGFSGAEYGMDRIYCCLRNAAVIGREAARKDSICLNVKQNVVVLSTPSEDRAKRYGAISKLCIGNKEFEVNAFQAAPENTSKGLIRNISKDESPADIVNNLVTQRNSGVLHAKCMGTTDNIIVLFDGFHVPRHIYYGPMLVRCSLYRKHIGVCYECVPTCASTPTTKSAVDAEATTHRLTIGASRGVNCVAKVISRETAAARRDTRLHT
ncbi:hypothetical protein MTO96_023557 [Rhipicephalus appendiculatus]